MTLFEQHRRPRDAFHGAQDTVDQGKMSGIDSTADQNTTNGAGSGPDNSGPSGFLSEIIGAPVTVKLNSGVTYKGELTSVDGYMNIALEQTREVVRGKERRNYGDAFVRGNNVMYISADS